MTEQTNSPESTLDDAAAGDRNSPEDDETALSPAEIFERLAQVRAGITDGVITWW
ncbi:MAG: hypothetical protein ACRDTA_09740 [Pseudonocardiaceae bacterium]